MSDAGKAGWFVYLARCGDGSLYAGITTNPDARELAHNSGRGAAYTRGRGPVLVVHVESVSSRSEALKREAAIKRLSREQKLGLIEGVKGEK